jgi:sugar O-acyltransferase (sialic acid O-acetyltransferase NeuD family)
LNDEVELYVTGAGGHAREIHAYLRDLECAGWPGVLKGFLDDGIAPGIHGRLNVLGPIGGLSNEMLTSRSCYLTALGTNSIRRDVVSRVEHHFGNALAAWTLIHPRAWIGEDVEIGEGTCFAPSSLITAHSRVGRHCIVNVKASISHDCSVGDFVSINPGATVCGWVNIGEGAYIGAGATIKDKVSIGAWTTIGAGAVVVNDIPANVTAVGVPARVIRKSL